MGFIRLRSTNPKLSYIIGKNPNSGIQVRSIRKGYSFGWYTPESENHPIKEFNVYFKDLIEVSYPENRENGVDYLNRGRYINPIMYVDLINEFFASCSRKDHPDDPSGVFENSLTFSLIKVKNAHLIKSFNKLGYRIEIINRTDKYGSLIITTQDSIKHLINYAELFCVMLMVTMKRDTLTSFPIERILKYAKLIGTLDFDFYLRYFFSKKLLHNKSHFEKIHAILEESSRYVIKLAYGDTQIQRSEFMNHHIDMNTSLLDIGCGNGYYLRYSRALLENKKMYYGVDPNPDVLEQARHKVDIKNLTNVNLFETLEDARLAIQQNAGNLSDSNFNPDPVNVIMLEVIEHMSIPETENLIREVLTTIKFNKFLITTPNADFNKYYPDNGLYRHPDHKWEMNSLEFSSWIEKLLQPFKVNYQIVPVGHSVDGIATTHGLIITK